MTLVCIDLPRSMLGHGAQQGLGCQKEPCFGPHRSTVDFAASEANTRTTCVSGHIKVQDFAKAQLPCKFRM